MSPWYQAMPNGPVGTCRTNSVKVRFGGRPSTLTCIRSFVPPGRTVTCPRTALGFGRQLAAPAETCISNEFLLPCAATGALKPPRNIPPKASANAERTTVRGAVLKRENDLSENDCMISNCCVSEYCLRDMCVTPLRLLRLRKKTPGCEY